MGLHPLPVLYTTGEAMGFPYTTTPLLDRWDGGLFCRRSLLVRVKALTIHDQNEYYPHIKLLEPLQASLKVAIVYPNPSCTPIPVQFSVRWPV